MRYLCAVIATTLLAGSAFADTINVPGDYPTIQEAIDAAVDGDEILVAPGTYTGTGDEVINTSGLLITLRATGTPEETIIDGEGSRRVFTFVNGEGADTIIEGFTIMGGAPNSNYGGGIYCNNSSPTISGCTIMENTAEYGGGVYCYNYSDPMLSNCTISGNTANQRNGGIYCDTNSSPIITGCTISGNTAQSNCGGIYISPSSSSMITDCTITGNVAIGGFGGGIVCWGGNPTITGCTISGNQAFDAGGGILCGGGQGKPSITDCTITNNVAIGLGGGIRIEEAYPTLTNTHVCGNNSDQVSGIWHDNGGNEIHEVCPGDVGACCTGNNEICVDTNETDCNFFGGTFSGYGVACSEVECPNSCLGDVTGDGQVNVNDLLTVIANWHNCP